MDSFLPILGLLLLWRTAVATTAVFFVAITLAVHVSWFAGGHGLAFVLLAFGAGLLWEISARPRVGQPATAVAVKLSTPVASLALAFLGSDSAASQPWGYCVREATSGPCAGQKNFRGVSSAQKCRSCRTPDA